MKWRKLGLVWRPSGVRAWAHSHAHLPTPNLVDERTIRVYFAALDAQKFGRLGSVDLDARDPTRVLAEADEPLLDLGELGAFDDCGVVPSCVSEVNGRRALYYVGFQRAERVPYLLFTGLALEDTATGRWARLRRTPVLDRTDTEPFSRSAPVVRRTEDGRYEMWYWSCLHWSMTEGRAHYNNALMYARSRDGITWESDPAPCLLPNLPDEYALGRPAVVREGDTYRMWFSARAHSEPYRIGYAESADGRAWVRKDHLAGIARSAEGWDSEMVCYPALLPINGRLLMFYNGNRHGESGFGVAVLEE